jgi:hypothetical protein
MEILREEHMTTYSKDGPFGRKYRTELYLIYQIEKGELQAFGLFETREDAEENIAAMGVAKGWQIADVSCLGWGIIDGVVERNTPAKARGNGDGEGQYEGADDA